MAGQLNGKPGAHLRGHCGAVLEEAGEVQGVNQAQAGEGGGHGALRLRQQKNSQSKKLR